MGNDSSDEGATETPGSGATERSQRLQVQVLGVHSRGRTLHLHPRRDGWEGVGRRADGRDRGEREASIVARPPAAGDESGVGETALRLPWSPRDADGRDIMMAPRTGNACMPSGTRIRGAEHTRERGRAARGWFSSLELRRVAAVEKGERAGETKTGRREKEVPARKAWQGKTAIQDGLKTAVFRERKEGAGGRACTSCQAYCALCRGVARKQER
ncbi:hypothetical protein B0H13DRAFT_2574418 [Mycena leptocephala]|nr:hypothetical protein B0H13DRAFT_2574418 [Mycena leptocephala]